MEKYIISYDIDILSRNCYFTTKDGLYKFYWGVDTYIYPEKTKINDLFKEKTKIRFDDVGKLLYISDESGIYISCYPYTEFTLIKNQKEITNFEIISNIG